MKTLVILSGPRCAGKTEVTKKMVGINNVFVIPKAITSRPPRDDDSGQYIYKSEADIEKQHISGEMITYTKYGSYYYGYCNSEVTTLLSGGSIPILTITPDSRSQVMEWLNNKYGYISIDIFIDSNDDLLNQRYTSRKGKVDDSALAQRASDREKAKYFTYRVNNNSTSGIIDISYFILEAIKFERLNGVLSSRLIKKMINLGMLIDNPVTDNIKYASYDLTVGDNYYINEEIKGLSKRKGFINIDPGNYAIVESKEIINLPNNICGRFDLLVGLFCRSVILSNSTQVDPGFHGKLYCLLFNPSNERINLKMGERYATLEFSKMIEPSEGYNGKYQNKIDLIDFLAKDLQKSVIVNHSQEIEKLKKESFWLKYLPLIISLAALAFTIMNYTISLNRDKPSTSNVQVSGSEANP